MSLYWLILNVELLGDTLFQQLFNTKMWLLECHLFIYVCASTWQLNGWTDFIHIKCLSVHYRSVPSEHELSCSKIGPPPPQNCDFLKNSIDNFDNVGFEVLTVVVMKSTIFWDITPCSPLSVNRRFEGTYRHHLQGRKISWARNQRESRWQAELCFDPEDGGDIFLRNVGWPSRDYTALYPIYSILIMSCSLSQQCLLSSDCMSKWHVVWCWWPITWRQCHVVLTLAMTV
jgi:hypothetical protein